MPSRESKAPTPHELRQGVIDSFANMMNMFDVIDLATEHGFDWFAREFGEEEARQMFKVLAQHVYLTLADFKVAHVVETLEGGEKK